MRRILTTLAVVTLSSGALAACGSDTKSSAEKTANSVADAIKKATSDGSTGGKGDSELEQLLAKQKKANVFVTYDDGSSEYSVAQDGHGNSAYITDDSTTISTEDGKTITCSGTDGTDPECIETKSTGSVAFLLQGFGAYGAVISSLGSTGLVGVKTTSEEIAGRDATCATISPADFLKNIPGVSDKDLEGAKTTICVDKETGTYLKFASSDEDGIEATDFRKSTPADFEPPAEPRSIEDLTSTSTTS